MAVNPIDVYRRQIDKELQAGNSSEHSHRPALKTLIESLDPRVPTTKELRRIVCGALDLAGRYEYREPPK